MLVDSSSVPSCVLARVRSSYYDKSHSESSQAEGLAHVLTGGSRAQKQLGHGGSSI